MFVQRTYLISHMSKNKIKKFTDFFSMISRSQNILDPIEKHQQNKTLKKQHLKKTNLLAANCCFLFFVVFVAFFFLPISPLAGRGTPSAMTFSPLGRTPRRRMPRMVSSRGSSQPLTWPSCLRRLVGKGWVLGGFFVIFEAHL